MRFATALALLTLGACPALAADPPDQDLPPAVMTLLTRPDHIAALQRAARAVDPPGTPPCPAASYVTTGEIGVLAPLQTDAKGQLVGGAIKEGVRETGCGAGRTLNAMTVFEPDGSAHTQALLPGTTIADPQLQQDSVPYAAGAMGQMPAGCAQGSVVNTRFVGLDGKPPGTHPAPGSQPAAWSEVWTLQACAKRADVTVHFKPDQTGTEIRADPLK